MTRETICGFYKCSIFFEHFILLGDPPTRCAATAWLFKVESLGISGADPWTLDSTLDLSFNFPILRYGYFFTRTLCQQRFTSCADYPDPTSPR
jgi:hypothetical protein